MSRLRMFAEVAILSAVDMAARCVVVGLFAWVAWFMVGAAMSTTLEGFLAGLVVAVMAGALRSEAPKIGGGK